MSSSACNATPTRGGAKRDALLAAGARHVIATDEQDLVAEVKQITEGKGARIAFGPVGGPEVPKVLEALSYLGIFFQYGALDFSDVPVPVLALLGRNLTIRGYQLFEVSKDPARLEEAKRYVVDGRASGGLKPVIARTFKFDEIVEATRFMESNAQVGKRGHALSERGVRRQRRTPRSLSGFAPESDPGCPTVACTNCPLPKRNFSRSAEDEQLSRSS